MKLWESELSQSSLAVAHQVLADAAQRSALVSSNLARPASRSNGAPLASRSHMEHVPLHSLGTDDMEHPDHADSNLQTRLCNIACGGKLAAVQDRLMQCGDNPGLNLLQDLRSPNTDHSWLWMLSTATGDELRGHEFCVAVRLRIGADVTRAGTPCKCCGEPLDARCLHALRCAPGESTRGHNRVSNTLLGLASLGDSASCAEPRGLVASRPALRPADILTSAAFARGAALDVSIVSPDAEGAGLDPCTAAVRGKLEKYGPVVQELRDAGIDYRPLTWSCWGRPDSVSSTVIRSMASTAARRRGLGSPAPLISRTEALIGAQIWRRAAAMVLCCTGSGSGGDLEEVLAQVEGASDSSVCGDESCDDV